MIKTKKKDDPSGSRTLLRLHRALEYIIAFLHKLDDIQDADLCSVISVEAYEATLMKYHPWVVQVWIIETLHACINEVLPCFIVILIPHGSTVHC